MYRKVVCLLLVLVMLFALSVNSFALTGQERYYIHDVEMGLCRTITGETMLIPALAYIDEEILPMSTTVIDEALIGTTSNPSNGVISFTLRVPAGATATYSVDLIPNNHNEAIDHKNGSYTNTGSTTVTRTIRVNVNYYTQGYIISATYSTGPDRDRVYHVDEHTQTSRLVSRVSTERFVWDAENIAIYDAGQDVYTLLSFAVTGGVSLCFVKYAAITGHWETVVSVALLMNDVFADPNIAATDETLLDTPIAMWGYEFELVPASNGFKKTLVIYDDDGEEYDRKEFGIIPLTIISPAYR